MGKEIVPLLDEESAKAVQEASKLGTSAIGAGEKVGGYLAEVAGRLPHDLVGLIGDWVQHKRARRWADLQQDTIEILRSRGIQPPYVDVSPSLAAPLIDAALDDTRDETRKLWAQLLANALDSARSTSVRLEFVEIIRNLEPLDALMLKKIKETKGEMILAPGAAQDDVLVSLASLERLGLIVGPHSKPELAGLRGFILIPKGRMLMAAVS